MTKIQIRKVNGVPMGRPVNELKPTVWSESHKWYIVNKEYYDFEQSVTEHEAPGFEEGEAEGELQWQNEFWNLTLETSRWENADQPDLEIPHRQIWIVSTPEKVEVKDVLISKEAVLKILEDARIRSVRNSNEFAETMLYYIIQEIEALPSPSTH